MNKKYEHAIEIGKEIDFLLGKDQYNYGDKNDFFSDKIHSVEATLWDIVEYGKLHGNDVMLIQFEKDLLKVLKSDLTCYELQMVVKYIQTYMRYYYEEKKINTKWDINKEIKKRIKEKYIYFKSNYHPTFDFDSKIPLKNEGFFLRLIDVWFNSIKKLSGNDFLEVSGK